MSDFDAIVVGSGATGAIAAQTLVDGGANVLVLDVGTRDESSRPPVPAKTFTGIRQTEPDQYRYFLGDAFESAAYATIGAGAQLTPPRRFIVDGAGALTPLDSPTFTPVESLARGGLAGGWGLLCGVYSNAELALASLPAASMRRAYQDVADRIGISGAAADDAQNYTYGGLTGIQPPVPPDPTARALLARYERARPGLRARGFHLGRPALALLTQPKDGREPTALRDMDFYDDGAEKAAWRAARAIDGLRARANCSYVDGVLVTQFLETDGGVEVIAREAAGRRERRFTARRLLLACGVLGTARIVLRSLAAGDQRLPLLCNTYTYAPCIVPSRVGRSMPERNTSLVQLVLFHDPGGTQADVAVGTIFSYRSLLMFRLLREMPLNVRDARILMQYLLSGFAIAGIDHPQAYSQEKQLGLEPDPTSPTGDRLHVDFALTAGERDRYDRRERDFLHALRTLGAWPLKRVRPPLGSSIHYAGTLPFSQTDRPFTLAGDGRLHGTRAVYVADGSGFTFLPAKGVTLSLMANAHRIARDLLGPAGA